MVIVIGQTVLPTNPPLDQLSNPDAVRESDNCLGVILALREGTPPVESILCKGIPGSVLSPFPQFRAETIT